MKFRPTKQSLPRPPAHLSQGSKKWFRQTVEKFVLDEHHLKLLTGAAEALDRATEARNAIAKDGAYQRNRFGELRKHPALGVERDAMTTFARLLRELGLDVGNDAPRPPEINSGVRR
jgi:P27 family predicted phage terminase small subunit